METKKKNNKKINTNEEVTLVEEIKKKEVKNAKVKNTNISKDKIIMASIIGSVIVIALVIFGVFLYNSTFKTLAKFDGGSLSISDFTVYYKTFGPMLTDWGYPDDIARDEIVNKASVDQIVLMLAKEKGIKASEEDLKQVDELMNNEAQTEQIKALGLDPSQMRNLYVNDFTIAAYIKYLKDNLADEEVRTYIANEYGADVDMREYVTRHVLFSIIDPNTRQPLSEEEQTKAKTKAEEVINRLNNGEKIEDLAKELSDDEGSAKNGGLVPIYMNDMAVPEYLDATLKLEVGKYTTMPVKTNFGYHVIYLEKYNEEGRVNSDMDRESIVSSKLEKFSEEYNLEIDIDAINEVIFNISGIDLSKEDEVEVYSE